MKIWVDDVRKPPDKWYTRFQTVNGTILMLKMAQRANIHIEVLNLDHDAGDYADQGGDYINILNYMEEHNINNVPVHIHSMNPVGVQNMRAIIHRNGWEEV